MKSILANVRPADVRLQPFPYVIVPNALDGALFDALSQEFPATTTLTGGVGLINRKAGLNAVDIIDEPRISPTWRKFVAYHSSPEFYREVLALFGEDIERRYPVLRRNFGKPLAAVTPKRRVIAERKRSHRTDEVVLDCQIMLDDTRDPRICRGPHVDAVEEIYAGLLYFRHPDDTSEGGELCILRATNPAELFPAPGTIRIRHHPAELDDEDAEVIAKVPYTANTAVLFINAPEALHKVTVRSATLMPRRHVNIIAESYSLREGGLFRMLRPGEPLESPNPASFVRRAWRRISSFR